MFENGLRLNDKIGNLQDDGVTISLLITEQCNFTCDHCMYFCSPAGPKQYMSKDTLYKIEQQVEQLQELNIRVSVNLVGGEPLLNLVHFERIISEVSQWEVELQMTTNGWWLRNQNTFERVIKVLGKYAPVSGRHDDCFEEGDLSCRISNDAYHTQERGFSINQDMVAEYIDQMNGRWVTYCPECAEEFEQWKDECPDCECWTEQDWVENYGTFIPPYDAENPWIYVESDHSGTFGSNGVIQTGRGIGWGDINLTCKTRDTNTLTYKPDGTLTDFCCRGSWMNAGTAEDHPLALMLACDDFKVEEEPDCRSCRQMAEDWQSEFINRLEKYTLLTDDIEPEDYEKEW